MLLFFFSSRRRHTRSLRDWSSDVCSSDLPQPDGSSLLSASVTAAMDPTGKGASELLPEWLRKEADGASAWRATLPLGNDADNCLRLNADLVGVELKYRAPLGKTRAEARPIVVTIGSASDAP